MSIISADDARHNAVTANAKSYTMAYNGVMNIIVPAVADASLGGQFQVVRDVYDIFRTDYSLRNKVIGDILALLKEKGYSVKTEGSSGGHSHSADYVLTIRWGDEDNGKL